MVLGATTQYRSRIGATTIIDTEIILRDTPYPVILGGGRIFVSVWLFPHKRKVVRLTVRTTNKEKI